MAIRRTFSLAVGSMVILNEPLGLACKIGTELDYECIYTLFICYPL
jgi:hypothetical protein